VTTKEDKPLAKKPKNGEDEFESKGRSIVENVSRLNRFLADNRHAYVDVLNNEWNPDPITDLDRDSIDEGANNFIRTANKLISRFKEDLKAQIKSMRPQRVQHLEAVTDILDEYLRSVTAVHSKQRAIRMEKELEIQKLSRLEIDARKNAREVPSAGQNESQANKLQRLLEGDTSEEEFADQDDDTEDGDEGREVRNKKRSKKASSSSTSATHKTNNITATSTVKVAANAAGSGYQYSSDDDNEQKGGVNDNAFSVDEIKAFEQENEDLYEDLMCLKDNVTQIQSQVVKISELQEVFTEKVLQQKDDIDLIGANAVAATENVRDGNEELRKAIQRNASIRVYILFFLIVMSFSLLFLDWYND